MHVFLIAAISIDGYIARDSDQISTVWTSKEDKKFFSERTKQAGVIVMGRKTFETIGRALPNRLNIVLSRQPRPTNAPEEIQWSNKTPQELLKELEQKGYQEVAICGGQQIYSEFLKAGLINTLYLTVEPIMFGAGVKLVTSDQSSATKLSLKEMKKLNESGTILLEYEVAH